MTAKAKPDVAAVYYDNTLTMTRRFCVVLNAFRHQRMNHEAQRVYNYAITKCSTPFGINE